jgi:hypothetical protein
LEWRESFILLFVLGELDYQNRVLAREADEHDEADLRKDVVVAAFQPHTSDREQQTHWNDENDGER